MIVAVGTYYFSRNFLPPDFAKLGRVMSYIGAFVRLSMLLLTLTHTLLLPLLLLFLQKTLSSPACVSDSSNSSFLQFLGWFLFGVWYIQHCGGALMRSFIDNEIFLLQPE